MGVQSIDAEDDQFAYRYDTQLLIDRRDQVLDEDAIAEYIELGAEFHVALGSINSGIGSTVDDIFNIVAGQAIIDSLSIGNVKFVNVGVDCVGKDVIVEHLVHFSA